jgi:hypothetical protein
MRSIEAKSTRRHRKRQRAHPYHAKILALLPANLANLAPFQSHVADSSFSCTHLEYAGAGPAVQLHLACKRSVKSVKTSERGTPRLWLLWLLWLHPVNCKVSSSVRLRRRHCTAPAAYCHLLRFTD